MIYIVLIIILLFSIYRYDFQKKTYNKYVCYLFPIAFALVAGLSYRMGVDCIRYENSYEHISFSNINFDALSTEPGFQIFTCLCKFFNCPWFIVHTIICLFVNLSISYFIKQYTNRSYFTCLLIYVLLFYYLFNFEILRQSIAMSIILLYMGNNNMIFGKRFCVFVFLAFMFHYVAIAAILIPLSLRVNWNIRKYLLLMLVIVVIGNLISLKFGEFLRIIEMMYSGLGRYNEMYSDSKTYTARLNILGQVQVILLQILPFIIALLYFQKKRYNNSLTVITLLFGVFVLLGTYVSILNRISYLFSIPTVILMGDYLITLKYGFNKVARFVVVIMLIMNVYVFYNQADGYNFKNIQKLQPYTSIFTKSVDSERESWINRVVYFIY